MLADRHEFTLISSDIHNKTRLTKREQENLIRNISTTPQPFLYTRHVHFLNFSRFRTDEPVHINVIRDPINRFLSNYFFRRFGDWRGEENHVVRTPGMKDDERYLDINTCILESYPECSNPRLFYIIPYFCGQHPQCREPGLWALETAKRNVLDHYLLVGVLEELEDVLLLLERLLPHFFSDVLNIYKSPGGSFERLVLESDPGAGVCTHRDLRGISLPFTCGLDLPGDIIRCDGEAEWETLYFGVDYRILSNGESSSLSNAKIGVTW
ncbi:uronyl 2-sulfotransferase-like [Puntigrus tetrazona]|uniref:uronyl 2-sulfotransferase-like n=1 Tax=Puntigrus tetrazona TaxID=1606681 RepID=UPI001C89EB05|nr:uronyl 2-sulfotransferase-like [Puntigrus tetrazona]